MRKTKRRIFTCTNKWYTVVDKLGRVIIPVELLPPSDRGLNSYCVYLNEGKIMLEKRKSHSGKETVRIVIPSKIRNYMGIKEDDVFEIKTYSKGFILERTDGDLIEQ